METLWSALIEKLIISDNVVALPIGVPIKDA